MLKSRRKKREKETKYTQNSWLQQWTKTAMELFHWISYRLVGTLDITNLLSLLFLWINIISKVLSILHLITTVVVVFFLLLFLLCVSIFSIFLFSSSTQYFRFENDNHFLYISSSTHRATDTQSINASINIFLARSFGLAHT